LEAEEHSLAEAAATRLKVRVDDGRSRWVLLVVRRLHVEKGGEKKRRERERGKFH
jgi:hypothetical protein